MPLFYNPNIKFSDEFISVSGDEFHHIANVFRHKIGDKISFTNGKGLISRAKIITVSKKSLDLEIINHQRFEKSEPQIFAAFSLLKKKNDELIIEKLTELGVKQFFPFTSERTIRQPKKNTIEKFRKKSVSAVKQCENAFLPKINEVKKLSELIGFLLENDIKPIVASEIETENTLKSKSLTDSKSICLIIGPEGGFDESEFNLFKDKNLISIKLGNHILRAETAAISAVSQTLSILINQNINYY